jgi:hypothetical protein
MADQIDEIGLQLRTMKSAGSLQSRIESWDKVITDPEQLGLLILDDLLLADATSGLQHSVFLYESMLLCCHDSVSDGSQVDGVLRSFSSCYPIAKWEFGPAMNRNQCLDILFAVPTGNFNSVRRVSAGRLNLKFAPTFTRLDCCDVQGLWKLTGLTRTSSIPIHLLHCLQDNVISGIWRYRHLYRKHKMCPSPSYVFSFRMTPMSPCYLVSTCRSF